MNSNFITENIDNYKIKTNNFIINENSYETKNIKRVNNNKSSAIINNNYRKINRSKTPLKVEKTEKRMISSCSCDNLFGQTNKVINNKINNKDISKNINEDEFRSNKKNIYNILVAVRCRPLNKKEREISKKETVAIINEKLIKLKDPNGFLNPNNIRSKEKILEYDYAFNGSDNQEKIFNCTTKILIDNIINGYNGTVFAYGATGAGKTYTMLGDEENPGIMPLTINELFKKIVYFTTREYLIKLWYIEIYNENIRDLLSNNKNNNEYLELREDPIKGIIINNVTEIITNSSKDILKILKKGNKNRTTEETNANETSSRSHAILQIIVSYKEKKDNINNNNNEIKYGKLNLIDLAGSERASMTKNKGLRLIEGANINKSLLSLGNCINALYDKNEKGSKVYVPFRDSKLTRLLKDSLGGNSRTVMIANISPFIYNFDDTYNTLMYAERARCIKNKLKINILEKHKNHNYLNLIKELQNKITILENKLYLKTNDKINFNQNKYKNINSITQQNFYSEKNNINNYLFDDNRVNDIDVVDRFEKSNDNKKQKNNLKKKNNQEIINIKKENDFAIDEDLDEFLTEKDKKLSLLMEDFIEQSEAEVQLKQKIINIQYNMVLIYNKLENNKSFKKNNSGDKIKLKNLKKIFEKNVETLKEISKRNENFIKKYVENNNDTYNLDEDIEFNYLQKKYIYLIYKNTKIQKENIEIKYKYTIIKNEKENNINYIKELEKQVKIRDLIIKELLFLDNVLPNNISTESNNKYNINTSISNILKTEEKNKYKTLNNFRIKDRYNNIKNKRKHHIEDMINRPHSISLNNKIKKNLYIQNIDSYKTNYNEGKDYIINFDNEDEELETGNSYLKLKIPTLTKSSSSFNIYNFDKDIHNMKNLKKINNKKKKIYTGYSLSNTSLKKGLNENNTGVIDFQNTEDEINNKNKNSNSNSNNKIETLLKEIKNMNTNISSKFNIIEKQSDKDIIGISGQIINNINNVKDKVYLNNYNSNIIFRNKNNQKDNLKNNTVNENENNNKFENDINNYSIKCQMVNNNISNRRSSNNINPHFKKKLIKSENNKNSNIRIFDPQEKQASTLEKILLSQGKPNNKRYNEYYKDEKRRVKRTFNPNSLNHINNYTRPLSQINKTNKEIILEKKKSLLNINTTNNTYKSKKENNNYISLNSKKSNISINKKTIDKDKIPLIDDISISQLTLDQFRKNANKNINNQDNANQKINNTIFIGMKHDELNKFPIFNNNNNKSFYFKKKSKDKISIYDKSTNFNNI